MNLEKIPASSKEEHYNVVIEIPMHDVPVKYEFDKQSGALMVDRFMQAPMFYPCNYGFIPHTLADDGDPVDVLVATHWPIMAGAIVEVRPVAVLMMEDESGQDEKILAVPAVKLDPSFEHVTDAGDLPPMLKERIEHFFKHYKELERGKWVKIKGWEGKAKALSLIEAARGK